MREEMALMIRHYIYFTTKGDSKKIKTDMKQHLHIEKQLMETITNKFDAI